MRAWLALLACASLQGQQPPKIDWLFGPRAIAVGHGITLKLPAGAIWVGGSEASRFLEFTGNPPSGSEAGVAGPPDLSWFASVSWRSYESLGFEARRPEAAAIGKAIREGAESANRERANRRRETLDVLDWEERPVFDARTGRLEFRLKSRESGGRDVSNRFVYLLGRQGVVEVELVAEAGTDTSRFERLLDGFVWAAGEKYEESGSGALPVVLLVAAVLAAATGYLGWRQRGQ